MPKNNRNIVSVGLAATMALIPLATQASDDGENWDDWVNQRLQKKCRNISAKNATGKGATSKACSDPGSANSTKKEGSYITGGNG